MQYRLSAAALVALAVRQAAAQNPTVTTPTSLVECQPAAFTVSGGTAPYFISILPGGQTAATPLETLPTVAAAGTVTWTVDIASGTAITIQVRDSTGALNYSQQVTVQAGTSTSCVGANSSAASGAASATSAASGASSAASASASSGASSATSSSATSRATSASSAANPAGSTVTSRATSSAAVSSSSAAPSASASSGAVSSLQVSGLLAGAATLFAALFA